MNTEKLKNDLDKYLASDVELTIKPESENEVVIQSKTGLVERIEKTLVTPDGRQLLTERIY